MMETNPSGNSDYMTKELLTVDKYVSMPSLPAFKLQDQSDK